MEGSREDLLHRLSIETDASKLLAIERALERMDETTEYIEDDRDEDAPEGEDAPRPVGWKGKKQGKDTCVFCDRKLLVHQTESVLVCERCGYYTTLFDYSSQNLSYDQTQSMDTSSSGSYKRINHFNDSLSLLQAKESSKIPDEIMDEIRDQLKKERIDPRTVKPDKIKAILKLKRRSKYYDHVSQIMATLTHSSMVVHIPADVEERLRNMFDAIQEPFNRHKPASRTNFFSYNYVFYKFCELLGETELMKHFPLLKSREKLYEQDQIWKCICADLHWEFRKTI